MKLKQAANVMLQMRIAISVKFDRRLQHNRFGSQSKGIFQKQLERSQQARKTELYFKIKYLQNYVFEEVKKYILRSRRKVDIFQFLAFCVEWCSHPCQKQSRSLNKVPLKSIFSRVKYFFDSIPILKYFNYQLPALTGVRVKKNQLSLGEVPLKQ